MMKKLLPALLLFALATPAQALKLIVWDSEMQTKLGAGESSGSKFNLQLVKDYSGPVKVIFSQSNDEKAKNAFVGLQSSYDGLLKNRQLSLLTDSESPNVAARMASPAGASGPEPTPPSNLPLAKFLQQFKLSLSAQTTGHSVVPESPVLGSKAK